MLSKINFNDLKIIKSFLENVDIKNYNLMDTKSVYEIMEISKFSHTKIRNSIKHLVQLGCLKEGLKHANAKTYLVTNDFLKEYQNIEYSEIPKEIKYL